MRDRYAGSNYSYHTFEEAMARFMEAIKQRPADERHSMDVSLVCQRFQPAHPNYMYWLVRIEYFMEVAR